MEYIEILKGLLTPLIGGIALYIAYQQHKTNKSKEYRESRQAKLDVYKKVKRFLHDVDTTGFTPTADIDEFTDAIAEADFLFPDELIDWLEDLHSEASSLFGYEEQIVRRMREQKLTRESVLAEIDDSPSWQEEIKYLEEALDNLQRAHGDVKKKFSEYIKLH